MIGFDLLSQTILIDGTDLLGSLYSDAAILINEMWLFRIAPGRYFDETHVGYRKGFASFSNLTVSKDHTIYTDFQGSFSLDLLRTRHTIRNLDPGTAYFVRCFAQNQEKGWSEPSATYPPMEIPRAAPKRPEKVTATVVDKTTINVAWSPSDVAGDRVRSYLVEAFTANPASKNFLKIEILLNIRSYI